jgi:hypothetical protein
MVDIPTMSPIDRALVAISDAVSDCLASGKPSRFAEITSLARIAGQLQQRQPMANVDDFVCDNGDVGVGQFPLPLAPRFNDGADLTREIVMLAQNYFKSYMEAEQRKASKIEPDTRIDEALELTELTALRARMAKDGESVPEQINQRIDHLLQRIGEPHAHQPDHVPSLLAEPLRGHPPNGAGQPNRDRVGEVVAERAGGDLGDR